MISMSRTNELQKRRLRNITRDYQEQGYEVILHPQPDELPSFLAGYQPDAVAHSEEESVVIEVMTSALLNIATYLPEVAQIIQEQPGWRFELAITNPKKASQAGAGQLDYLNRREVYVRMKDAQTLLEYNYKEASLLLLCSVIAASLIYLAQRERIQLQRYDPIYILKQLVFLAMISREDYWLLRLAMKLQGVIAAGVQCDELEENWLQEMFNAAMRLLQS